MLDLRFVRENPEIVKQNIRNKFQDSKLPLVDEVIALDEENRKVKKEADDLRASRNKISKQIGALMGQGKKEEAEEVKKQVTEASDHLAELEEKEKDLDARIKKIMMTIPNIIDPSVPSEKTIPRTWRSRNTESRWSRILRSRTIRRSWRNLMASIWIPQEGWLETVSTI